MTHLRASRPDRAPTRPVLLLGVCHDCNEDFWLDASIDVDRCDWCATRHAVYLGQEDEA